MTPHIVVALSDEHAGFKLGMLNPASDLIDGPYKPSASQEYLWALKLNAAKFIKLFAAGAPITVIHCGDPAHGVKYPTELVSTAPIDQIRIAVANWTPVLSLPNVARVRCATSTEAHSMGESSTDHLIADVIRERYPKIDITVNHHGLIDIDGYQIDYAHHGPGPGSRAWLAGNISRYYLTDIMLRSALNETRPPDLVLRGHMHSYTDETVAKGKHRSRIVTLPALCMPGRHALQVTQSIPSVTVGMMVFKLDNGRLIDERALFQTIDLRAREKC
jgi:hypothetical protein